MNKKYFTVTEANKALVFVKPIVKDIVAKREEMIELKKMLKDNKRTEKLKNISKEITYYLEELELVGCYLKDFELGVINFPSILNGNVVFLTWMYGETKIKYWHGITESIDKKELIKNTLLF